MRTYMPLRILLQKLILEILHKTPFACLSKGQKEAVDSGKTPPVVKRLQKIQASMAASQLTKQR